MQNETVFKRYAVSVLSVFVPSVFTWDVVINDDQEAVVSTYDRKLFRLRISAETLIVKQTIDLNFESYGIYKYGDKFIVTSIPRINTIPPSVNMIDMTGKVLWILSTDKQGQHLLQRPCYVNSCGDGETSSVMVADDVSEDEGRCQR